MVFVQKDWTQLLMLAMAVALEQTQSHPLFEVQDWPFQLPMQLSHAQDGSHASEADVNRAAARMADFIVDVGNRKRS